MIGWFFIRDVFYTHLPLRNYWEVYDVWKFKFLGVTLYTSSKMIDRKSIT